MRILRGALWRSKKLLNRILGRELRHRVQVRCPKLWLGTQYGGWCICPSDIIGDSVVYSFGVGEDISFDLAMIERFGVNVYAFDPTPRSIEWVRAQQLPAEFHLFEYGIAGWDGTAQFCPPENPGFVSHTILARPETAQAAIQVEVHRLKTIMGMLGHDRIDVLKMDVEGAEYDVIEDLCEAAVDVRQLLVEFHHQWKSVGVGRTKRAVKTLNRMGLKIFDVSASRREYSFIRS